MDFNIGIILLGCTIVVVALILVFKDGNKEEEDFNSQIIAGLNNQKNHNPQDALNHKLIISGLEGLNDEISLIKDQIERLTVLVDGDSHKVELSPSTKHNWENFEHSLNYNLFTQKNSDIINLFHEGQSHEEIARKLNKSVREVEMVIKLIK